MSEPLSVCFNHYAVVGRGKQGDFKMHHSGFWERYEVPKFFLTAKNAKSAKEEMGQQRKQQQPSQVCFFYLFLLSLFFASRAVKRLFRTARICG
jgi:hypothetical protein